MPARRSLKSRALQLLAQRDQSRLELRRKLLRHARWRPAGDGDGEPADGVDPDTASIAAAIEVDALLDWLEAKHFLSDARFAEARVHARQGRFGAQRIQGELALHGVELSADLAAGLAESELARAAAVRSRRFARAPADASERAAQSRFLLGRGFAAELVHRLMRRLASVPAGAEALVATDGD